MERDDAPAIDISNASHAIAKEEHDNAIELTMPQKKRTSPTVNAQDYDDPQAGPSGINQDMHRNMANYQQSRCYTNLASSSDDDSDGDREIMTSLWRSRGTFNLNQTSRPNLVGRDMDDDAVASAPTAATAAVAAVAAAATGASVNGSNRSASPSIAINHQSAPFLGNGSAVSHRSEINRTTSEILTAPDLQLDWLSDSSVDSEESGGARKMPEDLERSWRNSDDHGVVYVPLQPSPAAGDETNEGGAAVGAVTSNQPSLQIDLTISDDEDIIETTRPHSPPSPFLTVSHRLSPFQARNDGGAAGGSDASADPRPLRLQSSPVRVPLAMNRMQHTLYDDYHNQESHVGHLNCRSAYSTCDCLEAVPG